MLDQHLMFQERAAFRAIFAPGQWDKRAGRVLGITASTVRGIVCGAQRLTHRQRIILETYAKQRIGARSSHRQRAHEKLDREWDKLDREAETAILVLRAKK